eukprot:scaffold162016_cov23-Prasinocladus_malaysianus.AAC.1
MKHHRHQSLWPAQVSPWRAVNGCNPGDGWRAKGLEARRDSPEVDAAHAIIVIGWDVLPSNDVLCCCAVC